MSLCGLPGCGRLANELGQTCDMHVGMEKFIEPPNLGGSMKRKTWDCQKHYAFNLRGQCPYCRMDAANLVPASVQPAPAPVSGAEISRSSIDECTPAEWDAASYANRQQPTPKDTNTPALWDLVVEDMKERDQFGERKYTKRLSARNGRDFLADAYQEALDLAVYLRGALYERDNK